MIGRTPAPSTLFKELPAHSVLILPTSHLPDRLALLLELLSFAALFLEPLLPVGEDGEVSEFAELVGEVVDGLLLVLADVRALVAEALTTDAIKNGVDPRLVPAREEGDVGEGEVAAEDALHGEGEVEEVLHRVPHKAHAHRITIQGVQGTHI